MDKTSLAFDKVNFIIIAAGMAVVVIGLILLSGGESTYTYFDPTIFNTMRIKVAPVVALIGFLFIIYGVIRKPRDSKIAEQGKSADNHLKTKK